MFLGVYYPCEMRRKGEEEDHDRDGDGGGSTWDPWDQSGSHLAILDPMIPEISQLSNLTNADLASYTHDNLMGKSIAHPIS
jgi:hypothetical protein